MAAFAYECSPVFISVHRFCCQFHDLRHSAATILLSMGIHAKVVQELPGHSTITITMDVYSHVLPSMQQEAMDKWGNCFEGRA